jgi:hypothetical protein
MNIDVEKLLRSAKTQEELRGVLRALCEPHGPVVRTDVLSGDDAPGEMMCVVQMADAPAADRVANRFGIHAFGNRMVVFKYEAPADFACA